LNVCNALCLEKKLVENEGTKDCVVNVVEKKIEPCVDECEVKRRKRFVVKNWEKKGGKNVKKMKS